MEKSEKIKRLKQDIEYEQQQYDIACQYPTQTNQFYRGLEKTRQRISDMKEELKKLEGRGEAEGCGDSQ